MIHRFGPSTLYIGYPDGSSRPIEALDVTLTVRDGMAEGLARVADSFAEWAAKTREVTFSFAGFGSGWDMLLDEIWLHEWYRAPEDAWWERS